MTQKIDFSGQSLEGIEDSHVYVPDTQSDYRSYHTGKSIKTIKNPNPLIQTQITNIVNLPAFCTATGNPGKGSYLKISYPAHNKMLEVFTFEKYINSFIGHKIVRDVEFLAQEIAVEAAIALDSPLHLEAEFVLVGFKYGQSVKVELEITEQVLQVYKGQYREKYLAFLDKGEVKESEDKTTFLERVAAQTQEPAQCPIKGKEQAQADSQKPEPAQCPVKGKEQAQAASQKPEEKQNPQAQGEYSDEQTCPFVTREQARPGATCPVTGKKYE
ncbi:hypothetical protein CJP74_05115 [Psittacicella melopsittaci]|uniref:Uncharacterized protein n=1 Tax=Psittacicella melopsittaci TaxID=2028576 RepID=A0A3A1Y4B8_9GAMM|nr:hypothetical protein [Psittacicella melopsittaci]RIY32149.1 hypothetical protein CJP74_05115 [Psittacicella melopsittaci]